MSCNNCQCVQTNSLPSCLVTLKLGVVPTDQTDYYIYIQRQSPELIRQIEVSSPIGVIDVLLPTDGFISENVEYKIWVTYKDANISDNLDITLNDTTTVFTCFDVTFDAVKDGSGKVEFDEQELTICEGATIPPPSGACDCETNFGKTIFVDVNGNDSTGKKGDIFFPFKTIAAAELIALPGDTLLVFPGMHTASNLGKHDINYHLLNGAKLTHGGQDLFTDAGKGVISFKVTGNGSILMTNKNILSLNNASTVEFYVEDIEQTGPLVENMFHIDGNGATAYISWKKLTNQPNNWFVIWHGAGATVYVNAEYTKASDAITKGAGLCYFSGNYCESNFSHPFDDCFHSGGATGRSYININHLEFTSNSAEAGAFVVSDGGYLEFTGTVNAAATQSYLASLEGTGSELVLRNTDVVSTDQNNTQALIKFDSGSAPGSGCKLVLKNFTMANRSTQATSHGIQAADDTNIIEYNNTVIQLEETSGAKAMNDTSGTMKVKAFTNIISNGAWDGSNIISGTVMVTDVNVKE